VLQQKGSRLHTQDWQEQPPQPGPLSALQPAFVPPPPPPPQPPQSDAQDSAHSSSHCVLQQKESSPQTQD
jgi:hypothetical protein